MQEVAGEQGAAYIPMPKGRGFTPHFDNKQCYISVIRKNKKEGDGFPPPFSLLLNHTI